MTFAKQNHYREQIADINTKTQEQIAGKPGFSAAILRHLDSVFKLALGYARIGESEAVLNWIEEMKLRKGLLPLAEG